MRYSKFYTDNIYSEIVPQLEDFFFVDRQTSDHVYLQLQDASFTLSHVCKLLPINPANFFFFTTAYFSSILLPVPPFWDMFLASNSKWANILTEVHFLSLKGSYVLYCIANKNMGL